MLFHIIETSVTFLLCILSNTACVYTVNHLGKKYKWLKELEKFIDAALMVSIASWLTETFFPDSNSWWCLFAILGYAFAGIIGYAVKRICEAIWPKATEE